MVSANIEIINDLRQFLENIAFNKNERSVYITSKNAFTRNRDLPLLRLVLMILNLMKRSLSIEIQSFFSCAGLSTHVSKSAFCLQRGKLQACFFESWNKVLIKSYYKHYGDRVKRWKGFTVLAIDGTTLSLPNTETLRGIYGSSSNRHGTQGVIACSSVLYDTLNGLVLSARLSPFSADERTEAIRLLEAMPEESLLTLDRGYPCYGLLYLLVNRYNCKFVMRVSAGFNRQVKAFVCSSLKDALIEIPPTAKGISRLKEEGIEFYRSKPVKIRVVKIELESGEQEILMTNLYDTACYTRLDLSEAYFLRWGIETFYGFGKNGLQIESFSGIRPVCILQDFYANLFVYNLQSIIEKQSEEYLKAVDRKRAYPYKINKNVSWGMLKYRMVKLFIDRRNPADILMELQDLFERHMEPVRKGRRFPHNKKVRNMKGKYSTLTNYKRAL